MASSQDSSIRGLCLEAVAGFKFKVGIVRTSWNAVIIDALVAGALEVLRSSGMPEENIIIESVAGAYELPFAAQALLEKADVDAVICIGCLIKGETMHFEYISEAVTQGIMRLNLDYKKPVIYGVLNVFNEEHALARAGLSGAHGNEGKDWAKTALQQSCLRVKYYN